MERDYGITVIPTINEQQLSEADELKAKEAIAAILYFAKEAPKIIRNTIERRVKEAL